MSERLNCRPGDLAVTVRATNPANLGNLVVVVALTSPAPGRALLHDEPGAIWLVEVAVGALHYSLNGAEWTQLVGFVPDRCLRPLRDDDAGEETNIKEVSACSIA